MPRHRMTLGEFAIILALLGVAAVVVVVFNIGTTPTHPDLFENGINPTQR